MRRPVDLLIVRDVRVIDPSQGLDERLDVVIENGTVTAVGRGAGAHHAGTLTQSGDDRRARVVSGTGRWLLPGFIDLGAHFGEPGLEYKETLQSGLTAAAAGGYVRVCSEPDTQPINDTRVVTEWLRGKAAELSPVQLLPIGAATHRMEGRGLVEMAELKAGGAVAVGDAKAPIQSSAVMRRVLEYARDLDLPVFQHPRDTDLTRGAEMHEGALSTRLGLRGSPSVAEEVLLSRDLQLALYTGSRYHAATISTPSSAELVARAKQSGARVTCACAPYHLLLTDQALVGYDPRCKLEPPLRPQEAVMGLQQALALGVVDAVVSDHRPETTLDKNREFSACRPGAVSLELTLSILLDLARAGRIPLQRAIAALTTGPAAVLGVTPPQIRAGSKADLVMVEPEASWTVTPDTLNGKSHNTPLLGKSLPGRVVLTVAGGNIAWTSDASADLDGLR